MVTVWARIERIRAGTTEALSMGKMCDLNDFANGLGPTPGNSAIGAARVAAGRGRAVAAEAGAEVAIARRNAAAHRRGRIAIDPPVGGVRGIVATMLVHNCLPQSIPN